MISTKTKRLMIPAAAATALVTTALSACGGQLAATSSAVAEQTPGGTTAGTSVGTTAGPSGATTSTSEALAASGYTDGTYQGDAVRIRWGDVQVQVTIQGGQIADVQFLTYPTDRRSEQINSQAAPLLVQEAVQAQSANVQVISGATFTSQAFMESLSSALSQA